MSEPLGAVTDHLGAHFATLGMDCRPDVASVTFLGVERIDVLRFGPDPRPGLENVFHHVSLGCSRYPMADPSAPVSDRLRGPRAEVVLSLRANAAATGLARSVAVVAATPAVEGVVLAPGALVDLSGPLWDGAPFTAVLLGESDIPDLALAPPREPVQFLAAVPVTATEGAWVRLKGAGAMRQAWADDRVDVLDPLRPASSAGAR
ncbi:MAG: suppressor of fused domain protein [Mycobacterium sp.]|nr:suppressor of fused domain protein [Mycobacterium sp.]